ncbi:MAG: histidine kinase [Candidatus Izimaplasma sp.]|nr:histidine kinase [Candidatus Izimaplasma bacterium]
MKWFNKLSIGKRLNISFVAVISLAIIFTGFFTFNRSYDTIDTIVEDSSKEINKQIILNYENYFNDVRNLANYIESETEKHDLNDSEILEALYVDYARLNTDTITISLLDMDGMVLVSSQSSSLQSMYLKQRDWFQNAVLNDGIYYFSPPHYQDIFQSSSEMVISVSKVIDYTSNGISYQGVMLLDLSTDKIEVLAKQTNLGDDGYMIIISDTGQLVYSSNESCLDPSCESVKWVQDTIIGSDYITLDGADLYGNINTIHGTRWRIATFVDVNIIDATRTNMIVSLIGVLAATVVASTITAYVLTRQITLPLQKLTAHMQEIETHENFHQKVSIEGQKEVVILAHAYNQMTEEIKGLMDRLVTEQKEKRKTEFIALQAQINPHFLYNTLDSIVWLSEQKRNEDVIQMVIALSRFFRVAISRGKTIIPIEKEIEHAKNYLLIQKIRYSDKFNFEFEIDEEVYQYSVVKLILQPILENAIQHGISAEFDGYIEIRLLLKNDSVVFEVENNGYGLTQNQINEIYLMIENDHKQSVGLRNVYQRLKLYYGNEANLEISSVVDENTVIRITIPKQEVTK